MSELLRGEKFKHLGETYTFLENIRVGVKVLNSSGKIEVLPTRVPEKK